MSTKESIVSVNVDVIKEKLSGVKDSLVSKAKETKNSAAKAILDKGIEISKKGVEKLEDVRKKI